MLLHACILPHTSFVSQSTESRYYHTIDHPESHHFVKNNDKEISVSHISKLRLLSFLFQKKDRKKMRKHGSVQAQ